VLDPGQALELLAAVVEGDGEDVAVDVVAEDAEELWAGEVLVAGDLDGGGGADGELGAGEEHGARLPEDGSEAGEAAEDDGSGGDAADQAAGYAAFEAETDAVEVQAARTGKAVGIGFAFRPGKVFAGVAAEGGSLGDAARRTGCRGGLPQRRSRRIDLLRRF
jgi:hypothetical protein